MVVAAVCPAVGLFLVARRMSLLGECLAHVSLAGAALGAAVGANVTLSAVAGSAVAAMGLERLRRAYPRYADLAVAVATAVGLGSAAVVVGLGRVNLGVVAGYLFGSLVAITPEDVAILGVTGGLVLALLVLYYRDLFYLALDEDGAKVAGIPVSAVSFGFLIMAGIAASLAMRLVGALLVASLMTLPVAGALVWARSFRQAALLSVVYGQVAVVSGLVLAYSVNTAPGGTIVLTSAGLLGLSLGAKAVFKGAGRKGHDLARQTSGEELGGTGTVPSEPRVQADRAATGAS
jgi:zinc transport system permease protein